MYHSSGNYEAFSRPRKPEGVEKKTACFVGSGVQKLYEGHAIPADSFARTVVFAMSQPDDVDINEES